MLCECCKRKIEIRDKNVHATVRRVCNKYGIEPATLLSKRRHKTLCLVRRRAAHALRTELDLSLHEIGMALHRDHTTVMHMLRKHEAEHAPVFAVEA